MRSLSSSDRDEEIQFKSCKHEENGSCICSDDRVFKCSEGTDDNIDEGNVPMKGNLVSTNLREDTNESFDDEDAFEKDAVRRYESKYIIHNDGDEHRADGSYANNDNADVDNVSQDANVDNEAFADKVTVGEMIIGKVIKAKAVLKEVSTDTDNSRRTKPDEIKDHKKAITKNTTAEDKAHEDEAFKEEEYFLPAMKFMKLGQRSSH